MARPRERGLKPERGTERAAAERSGAALIYIRINSALSQYWLWRCRWPRGWSGLCGQGLTRNSVGLVPSH
jgi:hypothetical protein